MGTSRRCGVKVSVAAGSVWESRMRTEDVKGRISKALDFADDDSNGGDHFPEKQSKTESALSETGLAAGKRKTWNDKNPVQIGKAKAEACEDQCRKTPLTLARPRSNIPLHTNKSPIHAHKVRSDAAAGRRPKSGSPEANDKSSPFSSKKVRSESVDGNERIPIRFSKTRSDLSEEPFKSDSCSTQLRKSYSSPAKNSDEDEMKKLELETEKVSDHQEGDNDEPVEEKKQNPVEVKEFGVCGEVIISSDPAISNEDEQKDKDEGALEEIEGGDGEEEEEEEEVDEEIEVEKRSIDVEEKEVIKQTGNRIVKETEIRPSSSSVNKLAPPVIKRASIFNSTPPRRPDTEARVSDEYKNISQSQGKLRSIVALVMWTEVSKSALVFGIGTFLIVSSSYARDLEISLISVMAYTGLVYLAAIFVFRTVIHRGREERQVEVVVREEEAVWILRLMLPYVNEVLVKLSALFSGDPPTTIKLGVVLFVMARCGSSVTIWNLAKLGFFGVFTVPKIFTTYSTHLSAYGKFWMRRFKDAWESCSHKKAVAFALFTLVWNLSSVVARVWAAFMLFVALRYYQQKMIASDGWREEAEEEEEEEEEEAVEDMKAGGTSGTSRQSNNRILIPNKLRKLS